MSNLSGPPGVPGPRGPDDPYGKIKVSEIQKDSQDDQARKLTPQQKSSAGFLKLIRMMKKFLYVFQKKSEKESSRTQEMIIVDLQAMGKTFDELKLENLSGDSEYLGRLSVCWHQFLRDTEKHRAYPQIFEKMEELRESINQYKANQDFALGHYLNESAGHEWIPFPCVEILKALYSEHHQSPEHSQLRKWTDKIKEIIHVMTQRS